MDWETLLQDYHSHIPLTDAEGGYLKDYLGGDPDDPDDAVCYRLYRAAVEALMADGWTRDDAEEAAFGDGNFMEQSAKILADCGPRRKA